MLQSAFVTALRQRSATDPDAVTKEISAMLAPHSRIFKSLSLNDRTHLFALHTDLTIGPSGGSGPSTRSRTRRNVLPVGVSALGGMRAPPIAVSQPAPKRRRQVAPPVEAPPVPPSPPVVLRPLPHVAVKLHHLLRFPQHHHLHLWLFLLQFPRVVVMLHHLLRFPAPPSPLVVIPVPGPSSFCLASAIMCVNVSRMRI